MVRRSMVVLLVALRVDGSQYPGEFEDEYSSGKISEIEPSLAVIVGFLAALFVLAFFVVFFIKCLRRGTSDATDMFPVFATPVSRFSGVDRTVVESLPQFRFCDLKGSREGLECAVCLSRFEDVEMLRLLPKCKHAFHVGCVDVWLESHSTCPICRCRVTPHDPSPGTCFLSGMPFELYVHRGNTRRDSNRFSVGSFRNLIPKLLPSRKHHHTIIATGLVYNNRWSCLRSSDMVALNAEMMCQISTSMFSSSKVKDDSSEPSSSLVAPRWSFTNHDHQVVCNEGDRRAFSDITCPRTGLWEAVRAGDSRASWISMVTKTVQWFSTRDKSISVGPPYL